MVKLWTNKIVSIVSTENGTIMNKYGIFVGKKTEFVQRELKIP